MAKQTVTPDEVSENPAKKASKNGETSKNLVIVESPAKAKTIKKYLGSNYSVIASMGHIIDLPKSNIGVDIDHGFEPKYITIRGKGSLLSKLKKEAKASKNIFLATDPDREGEAISYHLAHALNIPEDSPCRVSFNEITQTAVKTAIKKPRQIDVQLVNAQQTRRILDRIVGYKISPLLWKKVKKGLSAGRVQSVATRLICDREEEIESFIPEEYWSIIAQLNEPNSKKSFKAAFYGKDNKKVKIGNEAQSNKILNALQGAEYKVLKVNAAMQKRSSAPPFITSTLQQEASRKLNFNARKTMQAAQALYEGVDVKGVGTIGLITYMRTDSLRIAQEALDSVRAYIPRAFGDKYLPQSTKYYKSRKGAQDAHEAIRPTDVNLTPEMVKSSLTNEQFKLYKLIWSRFVASQMEDAVIEVVKADIDAAGYTFKANGSRVVFDGFMKVYTEGTDEEDTEKQTMLPALTDGQTVDLKELEPKQHFTQPPPRYTEASLVKALEEDGIGRPSTYAPTITTIVARGYVQREKKSLFPTQLGRVTNDIMKKHFKDIVDVDFTANLEKQLDDVEEGANNWRQLLTDFYAPFADTLQKAEDEIGKIKIEDEVSDVPCEKCGRMMVYKMGKFGKFLACPGFPDCRNTKPIREEAGVACPKCGGAVLIKKSKTGNKYFGCENNPTCSFMTWDTPIKDEKCPKCGGLLVRKIGRGVNKILCANEGCDYERDGKKTGGKEDK